MYRTKQAIVSLRYFFIYRLRQVFSSWPLVDFYTSSVWFSSSQTASCRLRMRFGMYLARQQRGYITTVYGHTSMLKPNFLWSVYSVSKGEFPLPGIWRKTETETESSRILFISILNNIFIAWFSLRDLLPKSRYFITLIGLISRDKFSRFRENLYRENV